MKNPTKIEVSIFAGSLPIPEWVNVEASLAAYISELEKRLAVEFPETEIIVTAAEAIVYNTALNVSFKDSATGKETETVLATINRIQEQLKNEAAMWVVKAE